MPEQEVSRRTFLSSTILAGAALPLLGPQVLADPGKGSANYSAEMRVISSANGLEATKKAFAELSGGADTLDAAIAGVNIVEDDPEDMSVGLGGLPNERGVVELDSAVMHGPTHRAGAVAALQNIRNPSKVAKMVLERTDHVLIVGLGALEFAKAMGFKEENLLTEKARQRWLKWKQNLSPDDDWLTPDQGDIQNSAFPGELRPTGTIHCAVRNRRGDISCVTTTSGLAFKIPGRVGDSPIIGAGLYVDNAIGSCGSTGRGEANLQNICCFAAVELMRNGMTPEEAGLEVLRRVAEHTSEPYLLTKDGKPNFGLKFYLMAKDGRYAGVSMYPPGQIAVTDEQGSRLEECAFLFESR